MKTFLDLKINKMRFYSNKNLYKKSKSNYSFNLIVSLEIYRFI